MAPAPFNDPALVGQRDRVRSAPTRLVGATRSLTAHTAVVHVRITAHTIHSVSRAPTTIRAINMTGITSPASRKPKNGIQNHRPSTGRLLIHFSTARVTRHRAVMTRMLCSPLPDVKGLEATTLHPLLTSTLRGVSNCRIKIAGADPVARARTSLPVARSIMPASCPTPLPPTGRRAPVSAGGAYGGPQDRTLPQARAIRAFHRRIVPKRPRDLVRWRDAGSHLRLLRQCSGGRIRPRTPSSYS